MLGKKKQASLDIFLEVADMELEYELAFAAICQWAGSCWKGKRAYDMYGAWKEQIFNASPWNKIWRKCDKEWTQEKKSCEACHV